VAFQGFQLVSGQLGEESREVRGMSEVRLVLSSEDYVGLVGELAERKLLALDTVSVDGVVYHTDNSGGTHFSDWAQDEFNKEVDEIENILAEAGIFKEVT
jgi:hypothetical protein